MPKSLLVTTDLIAIVILVFALYFPRYRRRDMVVAILGINVAMLAVATVLASAEVTAGLGLGIFGVLSIIRLRSEELDQQEIVYYFAALALGLLGGVPVEPDWLTPTLMGAVLLALFIGDHPRLFPDNRNQTVTLDAAYTDEAALERRLEELFRAQVQRLRVRKVDLVTDITVVDVRFKLDRPAAEDRDDPR